MNRRHLYLLYAVLWVMTVWLLYGVSPPANPMVVLFLYGPPVFLLYLFTLFFLDCRESRIGWTQVRAFFLRRRFSLILFFLGMVVLILLMSRTIPA